jgi:small subunit ribosomal protein S6
MPLYEHVFLSRQDVSAQQVETLTETFKGILEANGGSVSKIEQWGLKSVAFRIRKNRKAHYTLINIDAPAAAVAEMERQQRINEDVLRILTIKVEELEEGQSAMLQKRDRDDRDGDRGGRFGDRGDRPRSGGFRGGDRDGGGGGFRSERRPRGEETEGGAE